MKDEPGAGKSYCFHFFMFLLLLVPSLALIGTPSDFQVNPEY